MRNKQAEVLKGREKPPLLGKGKRQIQGRYSTTKFQVLWND